MAKVLPRFPATSGEKLQYMTHTGNDSSTRFVLRYPGCIDIRILRQAMRHLIDRVYILHSSFQPADIPHWVVNDGYTNADTVKYLALVPGEDVLAAAEAEALRPVYFDDKLQLYCVLADNGTQSALTLVVSHLIADGGDAKYLLLKLTELYDCILEGREPDEVDIKNGDRDLLQVFDNVDPEVLENKAESSSEGSLTRTEFPFPEPEDVGIPRILRRTIPADILTEARKKAKSQGSTVNDLMLAAYYRSTAKLLGMDTKLAVGTSSLVMTLVALTGAVSPLAMGASVELLPSLVVTVTCTLAAVCSARFANKVSEKLLSRCAGVVLILVSLVSLALSA